MNLEILEKMLKDSARGQDLVGRALEIAGVFAEIAASGRPLAPAKDLDSGRIAAALTEAFGKPVKKIVFISASEPDPALTNSETSFNGQSLWKTIETTAHDLLHSKHKMTLWDGFGGRDVGNAFWTAFDEALGRDLKTHFALKFPRRAGYSLVETAADNVVHCLFYFLGFCLNGNLERVQRLAGLMGFLPKAIPLGEKRNEPGTWFVLAA